MKPANQMLADFLDLDHPDAAQDILWCASKPVQVESVDGAVRIRVPFYAQRPGLEVIPDPSRPVRIHTL